MTQYEQDLLEGVRHEYGTCKRLLQAALVERPGDRNAALASLGLESTYLLRLYAAFESLLRARTLNFHRRATLASHIDVLLAGKPQMAPDPARDYRVQIRWRELLSRDRNALVHGRTLNPATGLDITLNTMQLFLRSL